MATESIQITIANVTIDYDEPAKKTSRASSEKQAVSSLNALKK